MYIQFEEKIYYYEQVILVKKENNGYGGIGIDV